MRAIVKNAVNCKQVTDGVEIFTCEGSLPDIAFEVTTIDGSKKELVLRNEDYNIKYIEFQPIEHLHSQGIQLLLGDTFFRKYYTEFNYKDRRLSFAVRVKKKGDFIFWVVLVAVLVLTLGAAGCFYAHKIHDTVFERSGSQNQRRSDISPEDPPASRGIVYSGQFGTRTQYTTEAEQPTVPSAPAPTASIGTGYRLSDGQPLNGRDNRFFSGILRRFTAPTQAPPDARMMREHRERLLSTVNSKVVEKP